MREIRTAVAATLMVGGLATSSSACTSTGGSSSAGSGGPCGEGTYEEGLSRSYHTIHLDLVRSGAIEATPRIGRIGWTQIPLPHRG